MRDSANTATRGGNAPVWSMIAIVAAVTLMSCQPTPPASAPGTSPAPSAPAAADPPPGAPNANGAQNPAGGQPRKGKYAVANVQAETVHLGPLIVSNATAGTVVADVQSSVAAQTAGTVLTQVHKAGDWVSAGETVIKLDDSQLKLSLQIAQNNYENAKITAGQGVNSKSKLQLSAAQKAYDADMQLSKIGGISQADLDTAQANLEAAKIAVQQDASALDTADLQVKQAQLNLAYAAIKAPFDGQIVSISVVPGEYVSANTTAFVIVSRAKDVNFNVPPSDVGGLTHGAKISFTLAGKATNVSLIGVPSAPVNGLVPLQAALPRGYTGSYGMVGTVSYSQVLATGILVPIPAIQTLENSTYVYVVGKDNKVAQAPISVEADSGTYAAVTGLNDGDVVVVSPPPGLLPGTPVKILKPLSDNASYSSAPASGDKQKWAGGKGGQ